MIHEDALLKVRNKSFFYPCSGYDWYEPINKFAPYICDFWFVDIVYKDLNKLKSLAEKSSDLILYSREIIGPLYALKEERVDSNGHKYSYLQPGILKERYKHIPSGNLIDVHRRRGFGQYALTQEFSNTSIGIFMHRGDSIGDGGSNIWYLANKSKRHEPVSKLFAKLSLKLCSQALIVTDGSNTKIKQLKRYYKNFEIDSEIASKQASSFTKWNFNWKCVGYMNKKYGPTLVWKLRHIE